jgi:hypothetical protein
VSQVPPAQLKVPVSTCGTGIFFLCARHGSPLPAQRPGPLRGTSAVFSPTPWPPARHYGRLLANALAPCLAWRCNPRLGESNIVTDGGSLIVLLVRLGSGVEPRCGCPVVSSLSGFDPNSGTKIASSIPEHVHFEIGLALQWVQLALPGFPGSYTDLFPSRPIMPRNAEHPSVGYEVSLRRIHVSPGILRCHSPGCEVVERGSEKGADGIQEEGRGLGGQSTVLAGGGRRGGGGGMEGER